MKREPFSIVLGRNLLAVAIFWTLGWVAIRAANFIVHNAYVQDPVAILSCVLSVWIAFRLRAVYAAAFLGAVAVTFSVEFLCHVIFGYSTVQTGPVHMAVLAASLVALIVGVLLAPHLTARRDDGPADRHAGLQSARADAEFGAAI